MTRIVFLVGFEFAVWGLGNLGLGFGGIPIGVAAAALSSDQKM